MLITILKIGFKGKSFYNNPKNFTEGAVKELGLSVLVGPVVFAILFFALLFVLSFTSLLGGPFLLAKIFFWFIVVCYAILAVPLFAFYKIVKSIGKQAGTVTERVFVASDVKE